jgi:hypothetical protein
MVTRREPILLVLVLLIAKHIIVRTGYQSTVRQAHERVVLTAFHIMLVVEFSWAYFEVKIGVIYRIFKMGDKPCFGKKWA